MAKKRTPPSQLVQSSVPKRQGTWFDRIPSSDQKYIRDVVYAMRENPNAAQYLVADQLIEILLLSASRQTVVRKLKEMLNEKA